MKHTLMRHPVDKRGIGIMSNQIAPKHYISHTNKPTILFLFNFWKISTNSKQTMAIIPFYP